jgi:hypothetical protein
MLFKTLHLQQDPGILACISHRFVLQLNTFSVHIYIEIERDFEIAYPGKENRLFEQWPKLAPKVLVLLWKTVKDKNVHQLLSVADGGSSKGINLDVLVTVIYQ